MVWTRIQMAQDSGHSVTLRDIHNTEGDVSQTATPAQPASSNPYGVTLYPVSTPSGGTLPLQTADEADWYDQRRDQYVAQNRFPNVSDLLDLDRLLQLEIMTFRWGQWISQGFDYMHTLVDQTELQKHIREYSREIRDVKVSLGIDKVSRDKEKGENVADYLKTLLERAKTFGYHRNRQYELAVTLMYELRSMVLTYDRCDEIEREELDLSQGTIMDWIRERMIGEWDELDQNFRENQKIWIREL
jgi:hypothetical protein